MSVVSSQCEWYWHQLINIPQVLTHVILSLSPQHVVIMLSCCPGMSGTATTPFNMHHLLTCGVLSLSPQHAKIVVIMWRLSPILMFVVCYSLLSMPRI